MARPRQYQSNAERQRAYRRRQETTLARVDRRALDRLHERLDQLQAAVAGAARRGDEVARACRAASVETTLEKLTRYFQHCCRVNE
jgi:hypothetical protein